MLRRYGYAGHRRNWMGWNRRRNILIWKRTRAVVKKRMARIKRMKRQTGDGAYFTNYKKVSRYVLRAPKWGSFMKYVQKEMELCYVQAEAGNGRQRLAMEQIAAGRLWDMITW
jgi:hypothetical protein